jgi:hypothetical protein
VSIACSVRRAVAGFTLFVCALQAGTANAQPVFFDAGDAPVVQIGVRSGTIVVNTWDRPGVDVESADDINVRRVTARFGADPGAIPMSVPMLAAPVRTPQGDNVTLPPENFVFSTVSPGPHDAILLTANDNVAATVHIPINTALLVVRSGGASQIEINNYRTGTFIVHSRAGLVRLNNDGGDGFVQVVNGNIVANNSNFNRIRARTAVRNIAFERCSAKQIEATSIAGSILYDGRTFQTGLARFETERGNVAIGVSGGARIEARGATGRVFTAFDNPASVQQRNGEADAVVGGGGALVSASSAQGSVYLFDGTLASKRQLPPDWQPLQQNFSAVARPQMFQNTIAPQQGQAQPFDPAIRPAPRTFPGPAQRPRTGGFYAPPGRVNAGAVTRTASARFADRGNFRIDVQRPAIASRVHPHR